MGITLDEILKAIEAGASVAQKLGGAIGNPDVAAGAAVAAGILSVIHAGVAAFEAHTGQPIDLTQLHRIEPIA